MDRLNHTFISELVLTAREMNDITAKINELVDNYNTVASGYQYIITPVVNGSDSTNLYFLQSSRKAVINLALRTDRYNVNTLETEEYNMASYSIVVELNKGNLGQYIEIGHAENVQRGTIYQLDIFGNLSVTQSTLRISITETNTGTKKVWLGTVQLTTMNLSPSSVRWYDAFISDDVYRFGSFQLVGALNKVVHLAITDAANNETIELTHNVGTNQYSTGYDFEVPKDTLKVAGGRDRNWDSGVYQFEIWVTSGTLESSHYTYNVMYVKSEERLITHLVCINEFGEEIVNASNNYLLACATYSQGETTSELQFKLTPYYNGTYHEAIENPLTIPTEEKYALNYAVNINTEEQDVKLKVTLVTTDNTAEYEFNVNNSAVYPATSGAIFYMNPATRLNSQNTKRLIINEMINDKTDREYTATWTKMAFVDGMDGWTIDTSNNRSCLAINAGSKVTIPYAPLNNLGNYGAFEVTFKTVNVSDYNENIISVVSDVNTEDFIGIRIRPDEVCVQSSTNMSAFRNIQNYKLQDEEVVNVIVAFTKVYMYYNRDGVQMPINMCHIFVNGVLKREFSFNASDTFGNGSSYIILGSDSSDLYIYNIRYYDTAFSFAAAHQNYVASLSDSVEKANETAHEAEVLNESKEVDFETIKSSGKVNYFIMEMPEDTTIPRYRYWTKDLKTQSTLEMHFGEHPLWDWKLVGVETSGQGTTSMNYWRWNFRWRIDKSPNKQCEVYYWNGSNWTDRTVSKTVLFDREHKLSDSDEGIKVKRITAKKNYASSQQSHKMGTTAAYNDLHDLCAKGANETDGKNEAGGRTAIFQVPAYGFERIKNEDNTYSYNFIGLYTIGPDKGDKPTFRYDASEYESTLITAEGLDHNIKLVSFRYPWNEQVRYIGSIGNTDVESVCIYKESDGSYEKGWEIGNCGTAKTESQIENMLTDSNDPSSFKAAYEMAYLNSPFILGLDYPTFNINAINRNVTEFGATVDDNYDNYRPYSYYEIYFTSSYTVENVTVNAYDLYFLDSDTKQYRRTGINVLSDFNLTEASYLNANVLKAIGLSTYGTFGDLPANVKQEYLTAVDLETMQNSDELDAQVLKQLQYLSIDKFSDLSRYQKNDYLRQLRRRRFRQLMDSAGSPWHLNDCLFCHTFLTIFGATDNHAKNSYPYRFSNKWRWRQDDLDTIFDIDNQGHSSKTYSIEFKDWTDDTHQAYVFKGEDSAFWTLLEECYPVEIRNMGRSILTEMTNIGSGSATQDRIKSFFQKYYWDNAQNYFAKSAYNRDAVFSYEDAYKALMEGTYTVDVSPLQQSHGSGIEAELNWVTRRIVYCMSKYYYGPFASYTDTNLGTVVFRTQTPQNYTFTPAIDLYPCIIDGQSNVLHGEKTLAGETYTFVGIGGNNTALTIKGADYLQSLGDLSKLKMDPSQDTTLTVSSKRLQTLKIGDSAGIKPVQGATGDNLNSNITSLALNCPSLTEIDATNTILSGTLNLTNCSRIQHLYLSNSDVTNIIFAEGCKIESIAMPAMMQQIYFKNLKFLSEVTNLQASAKDIESVYISGCDLLNSLKILYDVYYSNSGVNKLKYIRITDVNLTSEYGGIYDALDPDGRYAEMLYRIAAGLDANGNQKIYHGLTSDGQKDDTTPAMITGYIWFESMISGYRDYIISYFQNRLEIKVEGDMTPTAATINLTLTGEEWIFDNEIGVDGKYSWFYELGASSEYYKKEVKWDFTGVPNNITPIPVAANGVYGVYLDLSEYVISEQNMDSQLEISFTVRSNVNSHVSLTKSVKIAGFAIIGITLSASSETLSITQGETSVVSLSFNPSNQTKARFAQLVYDDSLLGYNEANGELYVKEGVTGYNITEIYAKVGTGDYEVVSNRKTLYLNDQVIIYKAEKPGFTNLLSYIKNTLKVSESADQLTGREASKVNNIGTYLKGVTSITRFEELEYFISLTSLANQAMMGMTELVSIKFPPSLTTVGEAIFSGCTKLNNNGGATTSLSWESLVQAGRQLFLNCAALTEVYLPSLTKSSGAFNFQELFRGCTSLVRATLGNETDSTVATCDGIFRSCTSLVTISPTNFAHVTTARYMFLGDSALTSLPSGFAMPNLSDGEQMFDGCTSLVTVPSSFSTPSLKYMNYMFRDCQSITDWSFFDAGETPLVEQASYAFQRCYSMTTIPKKILDALKNVTNMSYTFSQCTGLTEVGDFIVPKFTSGVYIFQGCTNLERIGNIDISGRTGIFHGTYLFPDCRKLREIGNIDASNCTGALSLDWASTYEITTIGVITCPKVTSCTTSRLYVYSDSKLTNFGGFRGCKCNINCASDKLLTRQSALNVINECGDNSGGSTTYTITFSAQTKALLTEADIALATAKGYTIA